ncbi:hypothetical protein PI125_g21525 [Phytophthora idaei]|nr:hypothetical protein PI125_g21525 [Phytophthora idaei]
MKKRRLNNKNPIHLSIAIYQLAKLRMLQFYYDCIDFYFDRSDFQYQEMDTDSAYIAFSCEKPFQDCIKPELRDHFQEHKYDWFPRDYNTEVAKFDRRTPGLFKDEWSGDAMVSLSSKNYICYLPDESYKVKVSAKGVQQGRGRNEHVLNPDGFETVVRDRITLQGTNKGFRLSKETKSIITYTQTKSALSYFYDKRQVLSDAKCVFCAEEILCLGDFVGRNGVRMDPDKVQTIKDWPVPRTQEELHSFFGLTDYVQRFCPEYAALTASMVALLKKKDKRNAWIRFKGEQLKNFKELKRRLCNPPVLHLPDFGQPMYLRTGASKFAVGSVLFQVVDDVEPPIAYTSRKMKSAELNYPTQQQELLAIVHALAAFRIYCLDKPPIVETDHKSFEGLFTQKMANRRLARWYDILAEYQPTFSYLPGAKIGVADALSRRPDLQPQTKSFHDLSVTSFDDTSFSLAISEVTTDTELITKSRKRT